MQNENQGRIIDMAQVFLRSAQANGKNNSGKLQAGKTLILEPRTIRHQERVEDLFYLLFRRTGC
jgi:hypothetical protein